MSPFAGFCIVLESTSAAINRWPTDNHALTAAMAVHSDTTAFCVVDSDNACVSFVHFVSRFRSSNVIFAFQLQKLRPFCKYPFLALRIGSDKIRPHVPVIFLISV